MNNFVGAYTKIREGILNASKNNKKKWTLWNDIGL